MNIKLPECYQINIEPKIMTPKQTMICHQNHFSHPISMVGGGVIRQHKKIFISMVGGVIRQHGPPRYSGSNSGTVRLLGTSITLK